MHALRIKRREKNIQAALAAFPLDWIPENRLPDGNGMTGVGRVANGVVLRDLRQAGLVEYGREPQHSLCGYRITDAGRAALSGS